MLLLTKALHLNVIAPVFQGTPLCKQMLLLMRHSTFHPLNTQAYTPTDALRPIIPDNACILFLTAAAGTELADAEGLRDTRDLIDHYQACSQEASTACLLPPCSSRL